MKIRHRLLKVRDHKIQMEFQTALLTRSIRLYRPAPSKTTLSLRSKQEIRRTTIHWHELQNNSEEELKMLICPAMLLPVVANAYQKLVRSLKMGAKAMARDVTNFSLRQQVCEAQSPENQIQQRRKAHREQLCPHSLLILPTWIPSQPIQVQPP